MGLPAERLMTAVFEFLFKYRPVIYERGELALRPFWPWYVNLLLLILGIALAVLLYRRTARVLRPRWRYGLSGFRLAALLILLLIFLQPVLILRSVIPQKSFVAVAYDLSKSMEIRDGPGGESRLEVQKHLLRPEGNELLEALAKKFKLRFFRFSGAADRVEGFEDLPRHGNITHLDRSLNQIVGELGNAPVSAILLLTDGVDNRSEDLTKLSAQLASRSIPVYPIGIGSSEFARDAEILRVTAPKQVLKDAMIEADVAVRSSGYAGRKARLVVKEGSRTLTSQTVTLGSSGEVKTHKVNFSSETAGPKVFSFQLDPFVDEVISENNGQEILMLVRDERPQILYVEGEPRWIYAFLRRAASDDANLHLVTLLRQADGKFLRQGVESGSHLEKGFPVEKEELFQYKAIILGSVEASFFSFDQLRLISDFVSHRGGGFLMLGGKNSFGQGGYSNTPLEDLIPLRLRLSQSGDEMIFQDMEFKARLTDYGKVHPVTRLALAEEENSQRWEQAPSLLGYNPTGGPKPGATVLARAMGIEAGGQGPVLLAFQRFGRGKSMALTTSSTWRWRMEQDHRDNFHELFWKQMLRWLVSDVPEGINLESEKHSYSLDEPVAIRAEVNDESFLRINNAQITARIQSPSGQVDSVPLNWDLREEGIYTGPFQPREEGIYEVTAEAHQGNQSLGSAKTNFRIAESFEEYHNAALNRDLLQKLAAETGGRYYTPENAHTLPEDISYVDQGAARIEERDLWDMPFIFLILIGALSAEWILRKRKGLA
jgi:uncharacterized membrane protein